MQQPACRLPPRSCAPLPDYRGRRCSGCYPALEARGYVRRDTRERGWRLGFRLFELAQGAWTGLDLNAAAEDEIARLPELTGETVRLATLDGSDCVIVGGADGTQAIRHAAALGQRTPWHDSAGGRALVAFAEAGVRSALLAAVPERNRAALEASLELTRGRGYATGTDAADGVADLAAPVLDVRGNAAAALALAGPAYRLDDRRLHALAPVLMAAARRVSHNAGGTPWSLTRLHSPARLRAAFVSSMRPTPCSAKRRTGRLAIARFIGSTCCALPCIVPMQPRVPSRVWQAPPCRGGAEASSW